MQADILDAQGVSRIVNSFRNELMFGTIIVPLVGCRGPRSAPTLSRVSVPRHAASERILEELEALRS